MSIPRRTFAVGLLALSTTLTRAHDVPSQVEVTSSEITPPTSLGRELAIRSENSKSTSGSFDICTQRFWHLEDSAPGAITKGSFFIPWTGCDAARLQCCPPGFPEAVWTVEETNPPTGAATNFRVDYCPDRYTTAIAKDMPSDVTAYCCPSSYHPRPNANDELKIWGIVCTSANADVWMGLVIPTIIATNVLNVTSIASNWLEPPSQYWNRVFALGFYLTASPTATATATATLRASAGSADAASPSDDTVVSGSAVVMGTTESGSVERNSVIGIAIGSAVLGAIIGVVARSLVARRKEVKELRRNISLQRRPTELETEVSTPFEVPGDIPGKERASVGPGRLF